MSNNNKKLEELIVQFVDTKDNQIFGQMMEAMEQSVVWVPALPPSKMTPEMQIAMKARKPIPFDKNNQPQVCLISKEDGTKLFPIFTSREQIPKDKLPPMLMNPPFKAVVAMAKANQAAIEGIAVNPFSEKGVVLNNKLVDVAANRLNSSGAKTVQVTEKQFNAMAHTKVAREVLPAKLFKEAETTINDMRLNKEGLIIDMYKSIYPAEISCPYTEDDLAVMMLQIEDELLIVRVDMPEANMLPGGPARIYIACEGTDKVRYFIIEKAVKGQTANMAEILSDGKYVEISEAPDNGVEIETIMSLIRPS